MSNTSMLAQTKKVVFLWNLLFQIFQVVMYFKFFITRFSSSTDYT